MQSILMGTLSIVVLKKLSVCHCWQYSEASLVDLRPKPTEPLPWRLGVAQVEVHTPNPCQNRANALLPRHRYLSRTYRSIFPATPMIPRVRTSPFISSPPTSPIQPGITSPFITPGGLSIHFGPGFICSAWLYEKNSTPTK